jgi:predicted  nucleic acid-binding Zn-ribbon protein
MNIPELALHHQRLAQRAAQSRSQIARVEALLGDDPEVRRLEQDLQDARDRRRSLELRLRESERQAEAGRQRMRARERELMSGRIRNPTDLMKLSHEVEGLKTSVGEVEDAELGLMEEAEEQDLALTALAGRLQAARDTKDAARPDLERRRDEEIGRLAEVEAQGERTWDQLSPEWQAAYRRVQVRIPDPIAEAVHGQCQSCHVSVTSSGMQVLRRGGLVHCDNCGRLLVVT